MINGRNLTADEMAQMQQQQSGQPQGGQPQGGYEQQQGGYPQDPQDQYAQAGDQGQHQDPTDAAIDDQIQQQGGQTDPNGPTDEELKQVKDMLGVTRFENEAKREKAYSKVLEQYNNIDREQLEAEVEKAKQANESFKSVDLAPESLEFIAKGLASSAQGGNPDNITDSADAGAGADPVDNFNKKAKDGNATEIDLGDFVLANQ